MSLRSPFFALAALIPLMLPLAACDRAQGDGAQQQGGLAGEKQNSTEAEVGEIDRAQAGTLLPDLTFIDPDGEVIEFSALKGQPVLLNLWATWCAPCKVEMPSLDRLAQKMGSDLRVITVSQDIRAAEVVKPFFSEQGFEMLEPWLDPQGTLDRGLDNGGVLPLTILFDGEGREILRVKGGYHWDSEDALALISEEIAE